MFQARRRPGRPVPGQRRPPAARAAHGATLLDRTPVTRSARVSAARSRSSPAATSTGPAGSSSRPTPGPTSCSRPFGRRLPLTITKEQVTYFACPDPAAFAPERFPVWIWMDEPSLLRLPDLRRGRPEGRPGLRRPASDARRRGRSSATGRPTPGSTPSWAPPAGRARTRRSTRRPACTRSPRTATSWSTGCPSQPGVIVALGAAHGFKFASVLGRILAELGLDGATPSAARDRAIPDRPADPARDEPRDQLPGVRSR